MYHARLPHVPFQTAHRRLYPAIGTRKFSARIVRISSNLPVDSFWSLCSCRSPAVGTLLSERRTQGKGDSRLAYPPTRSHSHGDSPRRSGGTSLFLLGNGRGMLCQGAGNPHQV
ncbi:hypothetical protein EVA_12290 [gut metagenome]|uniref:Uncharacterized protein n=1 Tax=gut metagenome TaxID=749906 RepID=J9GJ68_9ZZZZ